MSEFTFTDNNFVQEVLRGQKLVIVDFFATWCGPCKMMEPIIEKLAKTYEKDVKIGKLDVDENAETGMKYEIQSIPTIIFFKDGEMVDKLIGFQSEEMLKKKIESLKNL